MGTVVCKSDSIVVKDINKTPVPPICKTVPSINIYKYIFVLCSLHEVAWFPGECIPLSRMSLWYNVHLMQKKVTFTLNTAASDLCHTVRLIYSIKLTSFLITETVAHIILTFD